jgi:hypothetical protein
MDMNEERTAPTMQYDGMCAGFNGSYLALRECSKTEGAALFTDENRPTSLPKKSWAIAERFVIFLHSAIARILPEPDRYHFSEGGIRRRFFAIAATLWYDLALDHHIARSFSKEPPTRPEGELLVDVAPAGGSERCC